MMPEHVYLCGLSTEQRANFGDFALLSLEPDTGNLVLKLEQMRRALTGSEAARLTDFIEIASYVFAADRNVRRGSKLDRGMGAEWRRQFRIVIAVRDLRFWERPDVKETLSDTLNFLSEDDWSFEFVQNLTPINVQQYLGIKPQRVDEADGASIVLFSGGIDSLAGAVQELLHTNRHVILVSHRNLRGVGKRQRQLANELASAHPRRVTHILVDNHLTKAVADNEETQRTRSFFFTAVATVAAHIESADRIRYYENGLMSINLPLATQVVGARASRSTHPLSLEHLGDLVRLVTDTHYEIGNPFIWKTKAEIVAELVETSHSGLITTSVSCTHARTANRSSRPHCGKCVQCLHRRISTLTGGAGDIDEHYGYRIDFLTGPREDGVQRVMAIETIELALDCSSMSDLDFMGRFAGPLSWVLQSFPRSERDEVARQVIDLHRRYGRAVRDFLVEASKPYLPDVFHGVLSPDSLLALVIKSRLSEFVGIKQVSVAECLPEPETAPTSSKVRTDGATIALDERRMRIIVQDLTELSGSTLFPIMQLLVEISLEDRAKPGPATRYRSLRGREIADKLGRSDAQAIGAAIQRARDDLANASQALDQIPDRQHIIQTTRKGYRLNPTVSIVTVEDLQHC